MFCICGLAEKAEWVRKPQIHKSQIRKSQKRLGLSQIANGPQTNKFASCGFPICGTYLRTAHLWQFRMTLHCVLRAEGSLYDKVDKVVLLGINVID